MKKGWYKRSEYFHLWHHILYRANHKDIEIMFNGENIKLKAGQFITGRKALSLETGINESKVERILTFFEKNEQQIEQQKSNKNRLITVLLWSRYQQSEQVNEQQVNNNRTTSEQQVNTDKNEKNRKNEKNLYTHPIQKFIIDEDLSNVMKLSKQLTEKEAIKLEQDYIMKDINRMLLQMENYKLLPKKSTSVNLTIRNWLTRDGVQKMDAGEIKRQAEMKKYSM